MSRQAEQTIAEAAARNMSTSATLEWLADMELEARQGRAIARRLKSSRLQSQPTIDAFHFHHHKSRIQAKNRILRLLDLTFLQQGTNLVLIGNPGVGKTFLAKVFGWKACQANKRVLFTTAMDMLNLLSASQVDHSLVRKLKSYTEPTLLICDLCEVVSNVELRGGRPGKRALRAFQLHISWGLQRLQPIKDRAVFAPGRARSARHRFDLGGSLPLHFEINFGVPVRRGWAGVAQ